MSAADEQDPKDAAEAESAAKKPARARKPAAAKAEEPTAAVEETGAAEAKKTAAKKPAKAKAAKAKDTQAGKSAESKQAAAEEPAAKKAAARKPAAKAEKQDGAKAPAAKSKAAARSSATARRATVSAHARYVRTSARKARMVCGHLRGKSVQEARAILAFTPRDVARDWSKLLESAVANAENNHELLEDDLVVREAYADEGPTIKRFRPRAMGRATPIRKRTSHLTITLTPRP
jgi:ribosomal protein L22